jgi:hypothetical protein
METPYSELVLSLCFLVAPHDRNHYRNASGILPSLRALSLSSAEPPSSAGASGQSSSYGAVGVQLLRDMLQPTLQLLLTPGAILSAEKVYV